MTFVVRRLLMLIPVAIGVTIVVFFMIHLIPGDPARTILGLHGTPQRIASAAVASEVGTPITRNPPATFSPSSSTKCLAVEPVPSPSFMPSVTCSSARAAACRFNASMSIGVFNG